MERNNWKWSIVAIEKGVFGSPSTKVVNFYFIYIYLKEILNIHNISVLK